MPRDYLITYIPEMSEDQIDYVTAKIHDFFA